MKWALLAFLSTTACDGGLEGQRDENFMLGNINGTRVKIPLDIVSDAMTVDHNDNLIPIKELRNYSTGISAFGFVLGTPMPGVQGASKSIDVQGRLGVEVSRFDFVLNPYIPTTSLTNSFRSDSQFGPYDLAAGIYGLEHWQSRRSPKDIRSTDIFFNRKQDTFISCDGNTSYKSQIHYGLCVQEFNIPELGVVVSVDYERPSLPAWRTLEQQVRAMVLSFRVSKKLKEVRTSAGATGGRYRRFA